MLQDGKGPRLSACKGFEGIGHVPGNTQPLLWHNLYKSHHMLPFRRKIVLTHGFLVCLQKIFREIPSLGTSVWMKTELREEKVILNISYHSIFLNHDLIRFCFEEKRVFNSASLPIRPLMLRKGQRVPG